MKPAIELLATHPLWAEAGVDARAALAEKAWLRRFTSGARILEEGAPADVVYLLVDGCVRVYYATNARAQVTVKILRAPAMFGEAEAVTTFAALARGGRALHWQETVEAVLPSVVLAVSAADYVNVLSRAPATALRHFIDVCERFAVCIGSERSVHEGTLDQRLLGLLGAYAATFGEHRRRGVVIDHKLSYESLANELGATPRTVARCVQRLTRAGHVARLGHRFVLRGTPKPPASQRLGRIAFATRRLAAATRP